MLDRLLLLGDDRLDHVPDGDDARAFPSSKPCILLQKMSNMTQKREDFQGLRFCPQGRGIRTVNVLPKPGSLVTPMVPLWALRIFWTMDNPSPVPFILFSSPRWT